MKKLIITFCLFVTFFATANGLERLSPCSPGYDLPFGSENRTNIEKAAHEAFRIVLTSWCKNNASSIEKLDLKAINHLQKCIHEIMNNQNKFTECSNFKP